MTWKDKLEIGLKEDAPYRKDNLPSKQVRGPQVPTGPGRSPEVPLARADATKADPSAPRASRTGGLKRLKTSPALRDGSPAPPFAEAVTAITSVPDA